MEEHDVAILDTGERGTIVHIYADKETCEFETSGEVLTVSMDRLTGI
jgi:hypothetical protein